MAKVVHVHLIGKRKDYYFSSISAVFTVLGREDIGVSKPECGAWQRARSTQRKGCNKGLYADFLPLEGRRSGR